MTGSAVESQGSVEGRTSRSVFAAGHARSHLGVDQEVAELGELVAGTFHVVLVADATTDPRLQLAATFRISVVRRNLGREVDRIVDRAIDGQGPLTLGRQAVDHPSSGGTP